MQGSMLDEKDMLRAGVKKADKAVLFAPTQKTKGQGVQSVENEAMIDADTIFAFQGKLIGCFTVVIGLTTRSGSIPISFLLSNIRIAYHIKWFISINSRVGNSPFKH